MPKKKISSLSRVQIITKYEERRKFEPLKSKTNICKQIADEFMLSYQGVLLLINRYLKNGQVFHKKPSGRPRKTTRREENLLKRLTLKNKKLSRREIVFQLKQDYKIDISPRTVSRRNSEIGLKQVVIKDNMRLKPEHRKKRLDFCNDHKEWPLYEWMKVVACDESCYYIMKEKGRKFVWRQKPESFEFPPVDKVKGKVMVWGCISHIGTGCLCVLKGTVKSETYINILENYLFPSLSLFGFVKNDFHFLQDNAPVHSSKVVKQFLNHHEIVPMRWPPRSPDLNPIENLWAILDSKIRKMEISNETELASALQSEWLKLEAITCSNLMLSIPKRINLCIKNKGGKIPF